MVNTPNWSRANISSKGSTKPSEIALIVRRVSASLDSPPLVSHPPLYPGNKQLENFFYPLPEAKKGRERRDGDFFILQGKRGFVWIWPHHPFTAFLRLRCPFSSFDKFLLLITDPSWQPGCLIPSLPVAPGSELIPPAGGSSR